MPRSKRQCPPNSIIHALNRSMSGKTLFNSDKDYSAFLKFISHSQIKSNIRICAYCIMPNHWHFALWPEEPRQVSVFIQNLTSKHTQYIKRRIQKPGHIYQGRFTSRIVKNEHYLETLLSYIEYNPVKANLVSAPEKWPWSSAWQRAGGKSEIVLTRPG